MLRYTGIRRKLDKEGRFVIPVEWRRVAGIEASDYVDISLNDKKEIIIRKIRP